MKKNIIFAAFAAVSALLLVSSCAKEQLRENINTGDGKVFMAVINQDLTKTTITDEYKVNWDQGDLIDISGGATYSATPDASDATKATFTKVSGLDPTPDYIAVYPASIFKNGRHELPATQTYAAGKFNAPMCAISETESLEFKNFCGVLCFALKGTDKVKSIAVTANEQLCGPFEFSTDATFGCFSGENEGYTVTLDCGEGVQLSATDSTNFYISLPPATYTAGMKIVITNTEGKTIEKTTTKSAAIARNQIYTFNWTASFSPAEPEYVVIAGLKWATMNLGAENVTDYGDYFAWGETEPYYEGTGGWPATPTWKSGKASGYAWQSYCGSSSFSEWSTPPYDATTNILKHEFDAAAQILGDGWRMPTSAEFKALYDACGGTETPTAGGSTSTTEKGVYWCDNYDGVKGLLFCDGTNKLFFPAAGDGYGTSLSDAGSFGFCWSSSLNTGDTDCAYALIFTSDFVSPLSYSGRYSGFSVRPVKDAAAPLPAGALKGEFSVSADKKVRFSQGNLVATIDASGAPTAWKFATNQYDHLGTGGANKTIGKKEGDIDLFGWSTASTTYGISTSNSSSSYSGDFVDWGKAYCEKNSITPDNTWRTLTKDEWEYLFITRTASTVSGTATARYAKATVNSKAGVILLPDTYAHPEGVTALTNINTAKAAFTANEYDSTNWEKMESAGAVFLPAAGRRNVSNVSNVGDEGDYWSSTNNGSSGAYRIYFKSDDVYPYANGNRNVGYGVRLVTEVK